MKRMRYVWLLATVGTLVHCYGTCVGQADELAELLAMDRQTGDDFGLSVAISGDCALVGAPGEDLLGDDAGAAYVFRFNGTHWVEEAKLIASDGAGGAGFGVSVAMCGDYALVGAEGAWAGGIQNAGAVYAFRFNGTIWSETGKLTAPVPANGDCFGCRIAMDDHFAVIGAWGDDTRGFNAGAAYIYDRHGAAWLLQQALTAPDGQGDDSFGIAVALDGSSLVVGASGDNDHGDDSGSAYVYRDVGGSWILQQKLTTPDGIAHHHFGASVAVRDSRIMVGAPGDQDVGYSSGAAYAYAWNGSSWTPTTKLKATDNGPGDSFGHAVVLTDVSAVVGARGEHAAYVFIWDGDNWAQRSKIENVYGGGNDVYAYSIGADADCAIVGAPGADGDTGSAYIYDGISVQTAPIYRFWSPIFENHFYTISQVERAYVMATWPMAWAYEEISYYAFPANSVEGLVPIYRFWSGQLGSHFYTADPEERDYVLAHYPNAWTYEGVVFYAFPPDDRPAGTVPVYRFWSDVLSAHFYTARESEKEFLLDRPEWGWEYECIAWYAYPD